VGGKNPDQGPREGKGEKFAGESEPTGSKGGKDPGRGLGRKGAKNRGRKKENKKGQKEIEQRRE
jgi:hypothetical protein